MFRCDMKQAVCGEVGDPPPLASCGWGAATSMLCVCLCACHIMLLRSSPHTATSCCCVWRTTPCRATTLLAGLTRLQLRSTHGTRPGGLVRFASLERLADLRLADSNQHSKATDVAMLLGRTCLTQLRLGYYPTLLPPLLKSLVELQEAAEAAAEAPPSAAGSRHGSAAAAGSAAHVRPRNAPRDVPARPHAADHSTPAAAATTAADNASVSAAPQPDSADTPQPPPLHELSVVLSPYMGFARDCFQSLVALTRLTRLDIGWLVRPEHAPVMDPDNAVRHVPLQQQLELSRLVRLAHLGLGWTPSYEVLGALGYLTGGWVGGWGGCLHVAGRLVM
ncbi:hypothetical protein COO60DRAFT_343129 [Scenedesmus sp. NREL 46B-D3]|nr:hypothetical protein COO60DRAFT_343129 [Scenedesmus sp. NREL 46B-D3]